MLCNNLCLNLHLKSKTNYNIMCLVFWCRFWSRHTSLDRTCHQLVFLSCSSSVGLHHAHQYLHSWCPLHWLDTSSQCYGHQQVKTSVDQYQTSPYCSLRILCCVIINKGVLFWCVLKFSKQALKEMYGRY